MILLQFVLAQAAVIGIWAVTGLALIGIGLGYRRLFTTAPAGPHQFLFAFWGGFAATLLLLQLWNFWQPVNALALLMILALGAAGLMIHRASVSGWLSTRPWNGATTGIVLTVILVLWAANHAIGPVTLYDSGMYHLPVVNWAKSYPVVPGLGNLHGRLAFNSAGLLFAAMLDHGPLSGRSFHFANSLLLVVFGLQGVLAWSHLISPKIKVTRADVFDALLLLPVAGLLIGSEISSLDTDMPVALMLMAAAARLYRSLSTSVAASDDVQRSHFAMIALVVAGAICAKLSAVVLSATLFCAAVWTFRDPLRRSWSRSALATGIPLVMGIVWMGRGVVLSGYPVYPSTLFGFPVLWRVPAAQAQAEAAWIRMSAHELNHNRIVAGFDWIGSWAYELLTDIQFTFMVPVPVFLSAVLFMALVFRRRRQALAAVVPIDTSAWLLLLPAIAGVLFWFVAAPHPRFGMGPLWIVTATVGATLFSTLPLHEGRHQGLMRRLGLALAACVLIVVGGLALGGSGGPSNRRGGVRAIAGQIIPPGNDHGFHPPAIPDLVSYTTISGLQLVVPRQNNLCWQSSILCTPHPAPNLRLRNPADVSAGFLIDDGTWAPVRWPNPWTPFRPWLACRDSGGPPSVTKDRACIATTSKVPTDSLERFTTPLPGAPPRSDDSTRAGDETQNR
ncbi:MAG: hypothetical protein U0132_20075 [Gemmatimonadaceae bacterium]